MMIILVRHGEATHHTQRLTGGWTDSQLTDKGRAQIKAAAVKLAKDFAGRNCKMRILASDLQRASASAQIIAEELGFKGEIEHCRFLREKNNGIAAGMTEEEAKKHFCKLLPSRSWITATIPAVKRAMNFIAVMYTACGIVRMSTRKIC